MTNDINPAGINDLLGGSASSSSSSASNVFYDPSYCSFRLPCGYCTRLCQPCPMKGVSVTWGVNSTPPINYCGGQET